MRRWREGFTLVEVMITLVILALVLSAVTTFFIGARGRGGVMNMYKQQSKIAQSGMDTLVGLEILRKDLESAGYGLPWNNLPPTYVDAASGIVDDSGVAPRGIGISDGGGPGASDYLVVKAANVATDTACRKWTTLQAGDAKRPWTTVPAGAENLNGPERVIVVTTGSAAVQRSLVIPALAFFTTFNNTDDFAPASDNEVRVVYGINDDTNLRMPFNRADYFIDSSSVPQKCAPNTGVLVKRVVLQENGNLDAPIPLLDCVADMQVVYLVDTDGDGVVDDPPWAAFPAGFTAQQIREQVKAVRVYLLVHEGQMDESYRHTASSIVVGEAGLYGTGVDNVDLTGNPVLLKYRWKLQTLTIDLPNLRG